MDTPTIVSWLAALVQAPALIAWLALALYLLFLTVAALLARLREGVERRASAEPTSRFTVVVPSHNEELVIAGCLESLSSFDYPAGLSRLLLIADNCTDDTAGIARGLGAQVYERTDTEKRGKGYALDWALRRLLSEDGGWTSAVVIFDADTRADPGFLRHMDGRLRAGRLVMQGQYSLHNPFDNWRTGLLYSALLLHNRLRPLARQALGWTTLLKGNGMCLARPVIERFGWNAYGLAEDIEYTTTLLDAGIRVDPVADALLYAQAAQTSRQADSQRMRWEGGRFTAARRDGLRLLAQALRQHSAARLDWAMDLFTPPMGILIGLPLLMLPVDFVLYVLLGAPLQWAAWGWLVALACSAVYVLGGLLISGADGRAYLYLLATPLFLLWKLRIYALMLLGRGPRGWVRTERTTM